MEKRAQYHVAKASRKSKCQKLRIIILFEEDFNMNNKWMERAIMFTAEQAQELAPKQYWI